jgi:chromate transporter, chromate ion transporter (CHR) family
MSSRSVDAIPSVETVAPPPHPSLAEATRLWLKIGCLGFGGPAGQIALMHRLVIDEKRWIDEPRFLHALNFCMLLPGPEAQQLATYLGWMMHGVRGGLIAGTLFVLPGALVMFALSIFYALYHQTALVDGLFYGIRCAVVAIVVEALLRISRRALRRPVHGVIAAASFAAIFFFAVPFPLIVLLAGAAGAVNIAFDRTPGRNSDAPEQAPGAGEAPRCWRLVRTIAIGLCLWAAPVGLFALWLGWGSTFADIGVFFAKMAVVTFGGAYAVLAYVAQQAVDTYQWLAPGEMLTGLGLAETTPGPLILVLQFVAFLAGFREPEPFSPLAGGIVGGLLALWVTFVPCFLWIFLGAPYVERLRHVAWLSAALTAITAAVVGVVLNLALWFTLHVVFARIEERWFGPLRLHLPDLTTLDPIALALVASAAVAMLRYHVGLLTTLFAAGVCGIAVRSLI